MDMRKPNINPPINPGCPGCGKVYVPAPRLAPKPIPRPYATRAPRGGSAASATPTTPTYTAYILTTRAKPG